MTTYQESPADESTLIMIALWGIGVVMHAWDVFQPAFSESRIKREMQRIGRG